MGTRYSEQLEVETTRVLSGKRWTLRQAEISTGLGYSTIHNMSKGRIPRPELLALWAKAIKEEPSKWLGLGNYTDLADIGVDALAMVESDRERVAERRRKPIYNTEFTGETLPGGLRQLVPLYNGLSEADRALAERLIRNVLTALAEGKPEDAGLEPL